METFNFPQWVVLLLLMMTPSLILFTVLYFTEKGESDKLRKENNALQNKNNVLQEELQRLENENVDLKNAYEQLRQLANSTGRSQTVWLLEQRLKEIEELKKRVRSLEESYRDSQKFHLQFEHTFDRLFS